MLILLVFVAHLDAAPRDQGNETRRVPLLDFRAELALSDRPYLHLTPEGVLIYFRADLLKTFPVKRLETSHQRPLRMSRVDSWIPELLRPVVVLQEGSVEDLEEVLEKRLDLQDVPSEFTILFEDGTAVRVTAGESGWAEFRALHRSGAQANTRPWLFLQFHEEDDSRQLYWHLQERMGVIY